MKDLGIVVIDGAEVQLLAGGHPAVTIPITVAAGTAACVAGEVMGRVTATGLHVKYDDTKQTGEGVARGALVEDVDATLGDVKTSMYVHGEFNKAALTGIDDAGILDLQDFGFYVKELA